MATYREIETNIRKAAESLHAVAEQASRDARMFALVAEAGLDANRPTRNGSRNALIGEAQLLAAAAQAVMDRVARIRCDLETTAPAPAEVDARNAPLVQRTGF